MQTGGDMAGTSRSGSLALAAVAFVVALLVAGAVATIATIGRLDIANVLSLAAMIAFFSWPAAYALRRRGWNNMLANVAFGSFYGAAFCVILLIGSGSSEILPLWIPLLSGGAAGGAYWAVWHFGNRMLLGEKV
jgi:hypothetical protein